MTDKKKKAPEQEVDREDLLFLNLIKMLELSVKSSMGLEKNPVTGEDKVDMESARINLDILIMIQNKTSGNLNDILTRYLRDMVTHLQMEYIKLDTGSENTK